MGFALLFVLLVVNIGWNGGAPLALAAIGALLVVVSQALLTKDRKRGGYWMEHGEVNPDPVVYSYGALFFTAGWVLVSWSMSLPMVAA